MDKAHKGQLSSDLPTGGRPSGRNSGRSGGWRAILTWLFSYHPRWQVGKSTDWIEKKVRFWVSLESSLNIGWYFILGYWVGIAPKGVWNNWYLIPTVFIAFLYCTLGHKQARWREAYKLRTDADRAPIEHLEKAARLFKTHCLVIAPDGVIVGGRDMRQYEQFEAAERILARAALALPDEE